MSTINSWKKDDNFGELHFMDKKCGACGSIHPKIMIGMYSKNDIYLCQYCATQLARKLLEDICDLEGGRHD